MTLNDLQLKKQALQIEFDKTSPDDITGRLLLMLQITSVDKEIEKNSLVTESKSNKQLLHD